MCCGRRGTCEQESSKDGCGEHFNGLRSVQERDVLEMLLKEVLGDHIGIYIGASLSTNESATLRVEVTNTKHRPAIELDPLLPPAERCGKEMECVHVVFP